MCRLIATTLGALIGCTDASAPVDSYAPVHASQADGRRAILDAFDAKDDAYVVVEGRLAAGNDYYRVTDETGEVLSSDGLACRHVHVGDDGGIDIAYDGLENGAPCQHRCKFAVDRGLTDFADAVADGFFVR